MTDPHRTGPRLRAVTAAVAMAAALLLSGCGMLPSPSLPTPSATAQPAPEGEQSGEQEGSQPEQCRRVIADLEGIAADASRIATTAGTDPIGALALVRGMSDRIGGLEARVTDPELLDRIERIQTGWDAVFADAGAATSGDPEALQRATDGLTQLGEQVTALQELCAGTA
ncbi:hypothetical protein [Agrococcus carbonis]|uniref:Uncharacterized protein n=1 Tax=Agrococcus carbonis TaxID=684552 RepID=A0A1H1T8M3_9MICO|nr:hypothetical protein [Agrococcus carbonis]SDS55949.1 hypothetical protein SAMN04489719_2595 [Agrococcus carbonis]